MTNKNISLHLSSLLFLGNNKVDHDTNSNDKNENRNTNANLITNSSLIHFLQLIQTVNSYTKNWTSNIGVGLNLFNLLISTKQHFMLITKSFKSSMTNIFTFISASLYLIQNASGTTYKHSLEKHYSCNCIRPSAIFFFFSSASYS